MPQADQVTAANYDAKKFKICCPWNNKRGAAWTLVFKPAFEDGCRAQVDQFASWHQMMVTETDFGGRYGPNHPAMNQSITFQSTTARKIRMDQCYAAILLHACQIQGNYERVKYYVDNDLTGAPLEADLIASQAARDAAIAANAAGADPIQAVPDLAIGAPGTLPSDWLPRLWRWMDITLGAAVQNGMLDSNMVNEWTNIKITDVGISRDTPQLFCDLLIRHNNQRRVALSPMDLWIKFHQQITFPRVLADRSVSELLSPSVLIQAGRPNAGQPDLQRLVETYSEVWHAVWDRGIEIKPQAAPLPRSTERSGRVDGMSSNVVPYDGHSYFDTAGNIPDNYFSYNDDPDFTTAVAEAYAASSGKDDYPNQSFEFLKTEKNCWNCGGFGHVKDDCPSDKSVRRSKPAVIKGLQILHDQDRDKLQNFRSRRFIRKPGRSPGHQGRNTPLRNFPPRAKVQAHEAELVVYDDGGIFSPEGEELMPPPSDGPESINGNVISEASTLAVVDTTSASIKITPTPVVTDNAAVDDLSKIETDIAADFAKMSGFSAEVNQADESYEYFVTNRGVQAAKAAAAGALSAIAVVCAVGLMAVRSTKGRALLTLLSVGSASACSQSLAGASPIVKIHSSNFSRYQCFDLQEVNKSSIDSSGWREHGILDSGGTECASGRAKLFPKDLVEQYNPPVKVEIASGHCLPVKLRGTMVLPIRRPGTTSAKKLIPISVPHSLLVPKMPVTLISTKALLKYCNIRTYFNDELFMAFPDGTVAYFVETTTNYTVLFEGDESEVTVARWPSSCTPGPRTKMATQPQRNILNRLLCGTCDNDEPSGMQARTTLKQPLPFNWDLCHGRFCHFSPDRISISAQYIKGQNIASLGNMPRQGKPCLTCVRGAFRGHRHGRREPKKYTRFGQRIYSDSCVMPKSTPFGFTEMYIFYDAYTKFIAVYFGKTTTAEEYIRVCKQFIADHKQYLPRGHVEEFFADGGPEFKGGMEEFCTEMATRRRFIPPWNPWMNVAETGWRIILRPLRIVHASANVTTAMWPFAVHQIVRVHNALSSASYTAPDATSVSTLAAAFISSVTSPPPSPYYAVTGRQSDLTNLRTLFCECHVRVRNPDDIRRLKKPDPVTYRALNLGIDSRCVGCLVYIFDVSRFTSVAWNDVYFVEDVFPRCDKIIGRFEFRGVEGILPSVEQQRADDVVVIPELADVTPLQSPPDVPGLRATPLDDVPPRRCSTSACTYGADHAGPCSTVVDAAARPRRPDLTHRDATRGQDTANILAAVEGDTSGCLAAATDHGAFTVAVAGDAPCQIFVAYNTAIVDQSYGGDLKLPSNTPEALNGPNSAEWLAAYQKDYTAKIKNKTFTLVPRPRNRKTIKTKVAHAFKREDESDSGAVTEYRARWVGMGFLQGVNDFNATYCATPSACSMRMFAALTLALCLQTAKGDVTKAFTLNPIDVELHVEQMPGMETNVDSTGRAWPNKCDVVCLLHKCLEGLKQAGNVWQVNHSAFIHKLKLPKHHATFMQSEVEPTLFIAHCSAGIIAILVWVDDIWVAFSIKSLYDEFVELYKNRFPSVHSLGCTKFAGVSIDYQPGSRMVIHQRPHIELAYQKFVTDKVSAAKSPAVYRPAVSDRNSPRHYSKLSLAANDAEREQMKTKPYLAALATLMYKVHFTSAHLNYYTSFLGQFMHDPSPACWDAILELITYDYHNREVDVIVYGGEPKIPQAIPHRLHEDFLNSLGFHSYSDASWLLRSPAGYYLFLCNGPIDWAAKLIRVICHSSAEAEIGAGCMLGKRVVFAVRFANEFKVKFQGPAMLLIDNTAADDLTKKFGVTPKTAHFLRWQHYLRYLVTHQYARIIFVSTKDQLADILTKVVDVSTFLTACRILFKRRK